MPELGSPNHPEVDPHQAASLAQYLQTDTFKIHLDAILPNHMSSERFASIALRQLSTTPKLQECSLRSVIGGMMTAATLGLEIGTQGECWLIPYGGDAQLQIGVWGHMALAWRSEQIKDVQIDVMMTGDRWEFQKGSEAYLHHRPVEGRDLDNINAIEWVYAVVRTTRGGVIFDAFDAGWIERIRSRSKSPNSPAWRDFYAEMAMAKALKKILKLCPKSREQARAITLDDQADGGAPQEFELDTDLLLPAEVALDPKTEEARAAFRNQQAKTPEAAAAEAREVFSGEPVLKPDDVREAMAAARDAEDGRPVKIPFAGPHEEPKGGFNDDIEPPEPEPTGNLGW